MSNSLLKPSEVDLILSYPPGKTARLARQGKVRHVVLPDGQLRIPRSVIDDLLEAAERSVSIFPRLAKGGCK